MNNTPLSLLAILSLAWNIGIILAWIQQNLSFWKVVYYLKAGKEVKMIPHNQYSI